MATAVPESAPELSVEPARDLARGFSPQGGWNDEGDRWITAPTGAGDGDSGAGLTRPRV